MRLPILGKRGLCDEDVQFLIMEYKTRACTVKRPHEWRNCCFFHEGEKARRRSPQSFKYLADPCLEFMQTGSCAQGDACHLAHGVFETWLHPTKFCTVMCTEGQACRRKVCWFAHSTSELRLPAVASTGAAAGAGSCATVPNWPPYSQNLHTPTADLSAAPTHLLASCHQASNVISAPIIQQAMVPRAMQCAAVHALPNSQSTQVVVSGGFNGMLPTNSANTGSANSAVLWSVDSRDRTCSSSGAMVARVDDMAAGLLTVGPPSVGDAYAVSGASRLQHTPCLHVTGQQGLVTPISCSMQVQVPPVHVPADVQVQVGTPGHCTPTGLWSTHDGVAVQLVTTTSSGLLPAPGVTNMSLTSAVNSFALAPAMNAMLPAANFELLPSEQVLQQFQQLGHSSPSELVLHQVQLEQPSPTPQQIAQQQVSKALTSPGALPIMLTSVGNRNGTSTHHLSPGLSMVSTPPNTLPVTADSSNSSLGGGPLAHLVGSLEAQVRQAQLNAVTAQAAAAVANSNLQAVLIALEADAVSSVDTTADAIFRFL